MAEPKFLPWRFVSGALAGAGFVAVVQIVTKDVLSRSLSAAIVCFAFSVPTMVVFYFYPPSFLPKKEETTRGAYAGFHLLYLLSFGASLTGLALVFFSFGIIPGIVFAVSMFAASRIVMFGSSHHAHEAGMR
jgi:hypothetical protein